MINLINIGGWNSGNGAIMDWLEGFEEVSIIKGELNVTRIPNGILDLLTATTKDEKLKICRHLVNYCFRGYIRVARKSVNRSLFNKTMNADHTNQWFFYKQLHERLNIYLSKIQQPDFNELVYWQEWLNELSGSHLNMNKTIQVLQNPFFYETFYPNYAVTWSKFFNPFKMIFIHRDPLDQFADLVLKKGHLKLTSNVSGKIVYQDTEKLEPAERFYHIAKKIYQSRIQLAKQLSTDQLFIVSFEDFVIRHEIVTSRIQQFLNISSIRKNSSTSFDITKSIRNVGIGLNNEQVYELLKNKFHLIEELNHLRSELNNFPHSTR